MDCSSPDALYEFAAKASADGTCPDGRGSDSRSYTLMTDAAGKWCYAPNFIQGACYAPVTESTLTDADCSTPGTVRVVKRVDGTSDWTCP
jgi:hypothetical protein